MILLNSFSANMLAEFPVSVNFTEIDASSARLNLMLAAEKDGEGEFIRSAVGHASTAAILQAALKIPVPCNRETVTLQAGDRAVIGQYVGPRLPEGTVVLPEGASIKWLMVEVTSKS